MEWQWSKKNTNEQEEQQLFLCFTSRLSSSSSSMRISKSILSPGRSARDTSSLSRRLKSNGSLKGGQSPMFSSSSSKKKTASGFDNPEPSSPKVTCIGQVRVKSRKKKNNNNINNIRSRSHRRSTDYSFRRIDTKLAFVEDANNGLKRQSSTAYRNREIELEISQRHGHNNQKWVHIPVTICESLRSFGSDFNCFYPCRSSSCVSSGRNRKGSGRSSCGSVLARWLVEGEGGDKGGRQIELVVGGEDEVYNRRKRHVLEDIDIMEIEKNLKEKMGGFGRDEGRVSICVPPKNALLLMRCGSDPVKMAALANRFWEPPPHNCPEDEDDDDNDDDEKVVHVVNNEEEHTKKLPEECENTEQVDELLFTRAILVPETEQSMSVVLETKCELDNLCDTFVTEEEDVSDENLKVEQAVNGDEEANDMEIPLQQPSAEEEEKEAAADQLVTSPSSDSEDYHEVDCEQQQQCVPEQENDADEEIAAAAALPDCLLLMMCEPKLSMEVSQETWVCSTDFIRCLPPREPNNKNKNDCTGAGEELSKRVSIHYKPPTAPPSKAAENQQFIPPRSSCSYPARPQNHEPARDSLYLTRCKSEPRRSTAKLAAAMPEGCFWKMEPRAPVGVSAAGMGF